MSVISNTQWKIHANNFHGDLIFEEQKKPGTDELLPIAGKVFGDRLSNIQLTGNSISFVRHTNVPDVPDYTQIYTGTIVYVGSAGGGLNAFYAMMGMFTEKKGMTISMPFMWSTDPLWIPG